MGTVRKLLKKVCDESKQYSSLTDKQKGYYDGYDVGYLEASKLRPTLREHYAGLAMQGLLAGDNINKWSYIEIAKMAEAQADVLIEQLNKRGE